MTGKSEKKIVVASRIAVFTNALLSILKITVGLAAGSLATVADGIDSASDVLTSLITLFTAHIISRPPNMKYPYGYSRADTMAAKILAFIIFFAGAQLAVSSFGRLINPQPQSLPRTIALVVIVISIISKQALAFYLKKTGTKVKSKMLIANAKNMQSDVVISFSVLAGLLFTFYFKMPVLDSVTALLVSVWIMGVAVKIFFENSLELMDGVDNPDVYKKIIEACKEVDGVSNPHRIRVRKIANNYLISLDIEVDGDMKLTQAHHLSQLVEELIKKKISDIFDVLVHVEPSGNKEPDEAFGISEKDVIK